MDDIEPVDMGFHVLGGEHLMELLRRAHAGEDPDMLFLELWANGEHVDEEEDDPS